MIYRFFKNATFNIIADLSNRISNALLIILVSKFFSVSQFGSYNLATTYFSFGLLFSLWGYGNLLTREVAKKPEKFKNLFLNFGVMRFFFSIIAFLLLILIASLFDYSSETLTIIAIISFGILAESFKNLAYSAFNAFEKTYYVSIVFFLSSLIKLLLSYILIRNNYGIYGLALVNTIVNYLGAVSLAILVFKYLPPITIKFDWKLSLKQTQIAIPLFLIALFSIAESRLDVIILSSFYSEEIVGFYSAALVLQSGLLIFPDGIRNAIFPVLSRKSLDDPASASRIYNSLFKYLTLLSLGITAGSIMLASKLIVVIYNKSFIDSIPIFRIIMLSYPFFSIVILNIRILNAYNKDAYIVKYYAMDMIITIVSCLLIMPLYGGLGAAYIKVFTTGLLYILFFIQVQRLLPNIKIPGILIRGVISSLVMSAALYFLQDLSLLISIPIGFMVFFASLLLLKTFGKEEIIIIKSIISQRKRDNVFSV